MAPYKPICEVCGTELLNDTKFASGIVFVHQHMIFLFLKERSPPLCLMDAKSKAFLAIYVRMWTVDGHPHGRNGQGM